MVYIGRLRRDDGRVGGVLRRWLDFNLIHFGCSFFD